MTKITQPVNLFYPNLGKKQPVQAIERFADWLVAFILLKLIIFGFDKNETSELRGEASLLQEGEVGGFVKFYE